MSLMRNILQSSSIPRCLDIAFKNWTMPSLVLHGFSTMTNIASSPSIPSKTSIVNNMEDRVPSSSVIAIVDAIGQLSLLETADLIQLLKIRLNLPDVMMPGSFPPGMNHYMPTTGFPSGSPSATASSGVDATKLTDTAEPVKTEFKLTMEKYDPASKAKIIREIKNILPGLNLVEAKNLVESVPKMIKEKVKKDEAEKLKKTLEDLGATIKME